MAFLCHQTSNMLFSLNNHRFFFWEHLVNNSWAENSRMSHISAGNFLLQQDVEWFSSDSLFVPYCTSLASGWLHKQSSRWSGCRCASYAITCAPVALVWKYSIPSNNNGLYVLLPVKFHRLFNCTKSLVLWNRSFISDQSIFPNIIVSPFTFPPPAGDKASRIWSDISSHRDRDWRRIWCQSKSGAECKKGGYSFGDICSFPFWIWSLFVGLWNRRMYASWVWLCCCSWSLSRPNIIPTTANTWTVAEFKPRPFLGSSRYLYIGISLQTVLFSDGWLTHSNHTCICCAFRYREWAPHTSVYPDGKSEHYNGGSNSTKWSAEWTHAIPFVAVYTCVVWK